LAVVALLCLVIRPAPDGLSGQPTTPARAASMKPAPNVSQETANGSGLLDWTASNLGAGAVTYAEGAGLGWLFSAFGVDMSTGDSAQVLAELQQISEQITALQGELTAGLQAVSCNVDSTAYSNLIDNNSAIPNIQAINGKLGSIAHSTDRAQMLTYISGEGGVNDIFAQDPDMVQEIRNLLFGTAGADGALQLYSDLLTTCHNYFNQTDSTDYLQVWNDLSGLLTEACTIDVNYYRYDASVASSTAGRSGYLTTAAADATACQGYAKAMLQLQPNAIPNGNEIISCSSPSPGSPCAESGGTGWQWQSAPLLANCETLTYGRYGSYPACGVDVGPYLDSTTQWNLPPYADVQTFLGSCTNSNVDDANACLAQEGWETNGQSFSNSGNVQFWTYTNQYGQPGQIPNYWADEGGSTPWPAGYCSVQYLPQCGLVGLDGSLASGVYCDCPGNLLLEWGGTALDCYWWCSSAANAATAAISQGESAAANVTANPPPLPVQPPAVTPQATETPHSPEAATPNPTETSRPAATATASPTSTIRPTETPAAMTRATETPHPTEAATTKPSATPER
jgi:hypothetical protein